MRVHGDVTKRTSSPASAPDIIDISSLCRRFVTAWLSPVGAAAGLPDFAEAGMPATVCAVLLMLLAGVARQQRRH